jgi:hypothetical protein
MEEAKSRHMDDVACWQLISAWSSRDRSEVHWSLFLLAFLVADLAFQFMYGRAYSAGFARNGGPPSSGLYWKAVLAQLPIVAGILGTYYGILVAR